MKETQLGTSGLVVRVARMMGRSLFLGYGLPTRHYCHDYES
jgi:hypothetical protein